MKPLTLGGIAFAIILVGGVVAYRAGGGTFYFESVQDVPWGRIVILIVAMFVGIMFGHYHAVASKTENRLKLGKMVTDSFSDPSLWRALFASPILFAGVYSAAVSLPDVIVAVLLSFENGFFCQRILERKVREMDQGDV